MAEICVDASFSLKLVLREPEQQRVRAQWDRWRRAGDSLVAPLLWLFETHSVVHRNVAFGLLSEEQGRAAWRVLVRRRVLLLHPERLLDRAWAIAEALSLPPTYDSAYLALAELRGCECWTADPRLFNATRGRFPWLHLVNELP